ncbi:MAG: hypothetical protein VX498_08705, partial [Myxococcota bacterium]|nr:hypothetical protein [Myxococcota bacterium]
VVKDGGLFFDGLLAAAKERSIPILSAERWAVQSWDRLQLAMTWSPAALSSGVSGGSTPASVRPLPSSDSRTSGVYPPQWIWRAGGDCADNATRPSPFASLGCLEPLRR